MKEKLWGAFSSKEGDKVEMEQLADVDLRRCSGEVEGFKGWRDGGAPPWLGVRERERERERVCEGRE